MNNVLHFKCDMCGQEFSLWTILKGMWILNMNPSDMLGQEFKLGVHTKIWHVFILIYNGKIQLPVCVVFNNCFYLKYNEGDIRIVCRPCGNDLKIAEDIRNHKAMSHSRSKEAYFDKCEWEIYNKQHAKHLVNKGHKKNNNSNKHLE